MCVWGVREGSGCFLPLYIQDIFKNVSVSQNILVCLKDRIFELNKTSVVGIGFNHSTVKCFFCTKLIIFTVVAGSVI